MLKPTHVHDVIKDIADNFHFATSMIKNGKVEMDLEVQQMMLIEADEVHFPNLIK
jgi:hypothetical protein